MHDKVMDFQELRQMPIFSTFSDEQLASLQTKSHELTLNAGEALFREGDPPQGIILENVVISV